MNVKKFLPVRFAGALKTGGFIYFIFNLIICILMIFFAVSACMASNFSSGYFIFILPLSGVFTGYWIRKGKHGWWRGMIMAVNIMLTVAIFFTAVFISPKLASIKQKKFENSYKQTPAKTNNGIQNSGTGNRPE